jgi:YD repeat-containing protein
VAFESTDSTFVFGDTNGASDIFVTGVQAGEPLRVSLSASGTQGNARSFAPSIRGDGAAIAFASDATNLVTGDTNAVRDVFVGPPLQPQVSSYGYDRLYRLTSASGPDGSRTYTYDPAGNRATIASGGTSTYGYDRADRISSITGPPAAGTSTRSPSSNDAGWASGGNAYASDNAYATSAPAKNTTTAIKVGAFGFDATVPANAAITSVTVTVEWKVSTTASIATLGAQAWVNGVAVGSEFVNSAEPMADLSQPFTVSGLTRAQLLDGVFQVRVRATRGNSNNVFTASLDAVSVRVNYTTPHIVTLTSDANGNTPPRAPTPSPTTSLTG